MQAVFAVILLPFCFTFGPGADTLLAHPTHAVNVNYVYGTNDAHPQTSMAPGLWLMLMMAVNVVGFYVPTHLVLRKVCRQATVAA